MLKAALACELECASNYMRHQQMAIDGRDWVGSVRFLGYAGEKIARSKRLGSRIVQLGGADDIARNVDVDTNLPAGEMALTAHSKIVAAIASESKVIDSYCRILMRIKNLDVQTRIAVEGLLFEELDQVDELRAWLEA